jgi:tungstate transport system substrate-binding protein
MKAVTKIVTILLIVIIIAGIGTYAAYSYMQNTKQNEQPAPTPTPTISVNATVTTSNQTYGLGLGGNVTTTQISNITITPSQSASTTVVAFNITGQSGSGFSNMTIPKTAIAYGTTPTVYIDGQQAQNQGYAQDTNNFYVWYTTHFSTHQVTILFTVSPSATPSPSPHATATPTPAPTLAPTPTPTPSPTKLTVATTTSLHDTGLEDNGTGNIKTAFQTKYPWITVNFIALGTGDAIKKAQAGDADMILVHSPSQEVNFLKNGYGVDRKIIAYNFFIIVGPASDPAQINGEHNVTKALIDIYTAAQNNSAQPQNKQVLWFSRNDASGTNTKEISLWQAAGFNYTTLTSQTSWFKSTGAGMGQTLLTANYYGDIGGYTITDTGTYLAYYNAGNIQLKVQIQAQQSLLNVYSAIIDNPQNANLTNTNFNASLTFISYLVSDEGQQLIANYGVSTYGQQLFSPFVPLVSGTASNATLLGWIQSYAYINSTNAISASGTECPSQYRYNASDLYSPSYDALANMNLSASISLPNYYSTDSQQLTLAQPSTYSQISVKINRE